MSDSAGRRPGAVTTVAAFDFDGTLTRRDSVVPFLRRLAGTTALVWGAARRPHLVATAIARRDRDRLRAIATQYVFSNRAHTDVAREAVEYGAELARTGLRDDTVARLRWHRDQGHRVVIVSASYELYVHEVARHLGVDDVDDVLATRLEVVDDRCTGLLAGDNCRAAEKVRRLDSWLAARALRRDDVTLWAYGDSSGDRELLAAADHPVWVRTPLTSVSPTD